MGVVHIGVIIFRVQTSPYFCQGFSHTILGGNVDVIVRNISVDSVIQNDFDPITVVCHDLHFFFFFHSTYHFRCVGSFCPHIQ